MSNSFGIYIKRAEVFQNVEFIKYVLETQQVGKVKSITLIPKVSANGSSYNGAIVLFDNIQPTPIIEQLLLNMDASMDGTCRYNYEQSRYWIIKRHEIVEAKEAVQETAHPRDIEFQKLCQQEVVEQAEECARLTMKNFLLLQENSNLKKQLKEMEAIIDKLVNS
jgi:hypothetical protein